MRPVRFHLLSDVFVPEPLTSAVLAGQIAEAMAARGHQTTVFAPFANRPTGRLASGQRRRIVQTEERDGYQIVRCWHTLSKTSNVLSRGAENVSFGLSAAAQVLRHPPADVMYMNTWPLFAQSMALNAANRRATPVVCAVKDLYPEALGQPRGGIGNAIHRQLRRVDGSVYRRSALVTPLNDYAAAHIVETRGIDESKVLVVYDWVDASEYDRADGSAFRARHRCERDVFTAMYVGSMTRTAGLDLYIETAEKLRGRDDIEILLVGDGAMRIEIENEIARRRLKNIRLVYPLERRDVPDVQAAADVLLLSLQAGMAEHSLPSKLLFYLFSGRPVVASVASNSPAAAVIERSQCGLVVEQGSPEALAAGLDRLAEQPAMRAEMGSTARRFADDNFALEAALPRMCDLLEDVVAHHKRAA